MRQFSLFLMAWTFILSANAIEPEAITTPPAIRDSMNLSFPFPSYKVLLHDLKLHQFQQYSLTSNLNKFTSATIEPLHIDLKSDIPTDVSPIIFERDPFSRDYNSGGVIKSWQTGYVFGMGGYNTLTGIGSIGNAQIGISQTFDRLTVSGGVSANKYNLANGVFNNFGVFGTASYRLTDKIHLNVFGSYYQNNNFYGAAAMPYLNNSNYGATMSFVLSNRFDMEVGAQRYYDTYSRIWKTIPIVVPSFRLNNGQKIGFDVGGLLYSIFESLSVNLNGNGSGIQTGTLNSSSTNAGPALYKWTDKHK